MDNKVTIAEKGGIQPLINLIERSDENVKVEAVAALANPAVNDENEVAIAEFGGLPPIVDCVEPKPRVASAGAATTSV